MSRNVIAPSRGIENHPSHLTSEFCGRHHARNEVEPIDDDKFHRLW